MNILPKYRYREKNVGLCINVKDNANENNHVCSAMVPFNYIVSYFYLYITLCTGKMDDNKNIN